MSEVRTCRFATSMPEGVIPMFNRVVCKVAERESSLSKYRI